MRKSNMLLRQFESRMGLQNKTERFWFWAGFFLLVIYVEAVVFAQNYIYPGFSFYLSAFCAICMIPLCFFGISICRKVQLTVATRMYDSRENKRVFLIVFASTLAIFELLQIINWPGTFSNDSIGQLTQAIRGEYSNWHPTLHTWLFFTIPYKIFRHPAAIITVQIIWFSLSVAYLFCTLYKHGGSRRFMLLGWLYIVANPNNALVIIAPWKDSAMSIFSLVLFTQLIQIYSSNGAWLKNWRNFVAFTAIAFLTNGMRHNAVVLIAPIFIILFFFIKDLRKRLAASAALVIAATILLQGPVFALANVEKPSGRVLETMGLPMSVLCYVYVNNPDALNGEARDFMDSLATPDEWEQYYNVGGGFNSIKWHSSTGLLDKVDAAGRGTLLRYMLQAFVNSPGCSLKALFQLTKLVWDFDYTSGWGGGNAVVAENSFGITLSEPNPLRTAFSYYTLIQLISCTKYIFCFLGTIILFLLFMAVAQLGGSLSRVFLVLAPMAYNFGTMLLLSGPDFRFFHFNFLIVVPLLFLLLQKERTDRA